MSTDLLFLSSRIALLVLLGSALAFALGWVWRSWSLKRRLASLETQLATAQEERLRLRNLVDGAAQEPEINVGDAQLQEMEKQCMHALQQRDEAERQAAEGLNRLRGVQEQLERLQRETVPRADYLNLEDELALAQARPAPPPADHSEKDQQLATLQRDLTRLQQALQESETALAKARQDAAKLEAPKASPQPVASPSQSPPAPAPAVPAPAPTDDFTDFPPAPTMPVRGLLRTAPAPKRGPAPKLDAARETLTALQTERSQLTDPDEQTRLDHQITALTKAIALATAAGEDTDDLTKIKGVKKVINNQLLAHGICTWKQIAEWSETEVTAFSELLTLGNRIQKERWLPQATELAQQKTAAK